LFTHYRPLELDLGAIHKRLLLGMDHPVPYLEVPCGIFAPKIRARRRYHALCFTGPSPKEVTNGLAQPRKSVSRPLILTRSGELAIVSTLRRTYLPMVDAHPRDEHKKFSYRRHLYIIQRPP
jgi:hypothetical protein